MQFYKNHQPNKNFGIETNCRELEIFGFKNALITSVLTSNFAVFFKIAYVSIHMCQYR